MNTSIDSTKPLTSLCEPEACAVAHGSLTSDQRPQRQAAFFCAAWLATMFVSTLLYLFLLNHEGQAGAAANPPAILPSETIAASSHKFSLLMFVHPKCPCSTASLNELAKILSRNSNVQATVIFFRPIYADEGWTETELWKKAKLLPNAVVKTDVSGRMARQFGARTSGVIVLYDERGKLLFHGGITSSRGHEGDNQGESIVNALLSKRIKQVSSTPVFGCGLCAIAAAKP